MHLEFEDLKALVEGRDPVPFSHRDHLLTCHRCRRNFQMFAALGEHAPKEKTLQLLSPWQAALATAALLLIGVLMVPWNRFGPMRPIERSESLLSIQMAPSLFQDESTWQLLEQIESVNERNQHPYGQWGKGKSIQDLIPRKG